MANLKQRLHKKNSSGTYDVIYLEADMSNVTGILAVANGGTGATDATTARSKLGIVNYTHPSTKQCNYSYSHPSTKQCDAAAGTHTHGNVTSGGAITASGVTIANGDALTIVDSSASGKLVKSSITFDGSTTTQALTKKGTWATFNNYTHPTAKQCNYSVDLSNYYTKAEVDAKIKQSDRKDWALGKVITWDNKEWLICHIDYSKGFYLIAKDIISLTGFGNDVYYKNSTLASIAASYQINNMSAAALAECVDITVPHDYEPYANYDVTAKVFIPSLEQMKPDQWPDQGFSWFNSEVRRIAYYNGTATDYWTSTARDSYNVWYVNTNGYVNVYRSPGGPGSSIGFRPCVCVAI